MCACVFKNKQLGRIQCGMTKGSACFKNDILVSRIMQKESKPICSMKNVPLLLFAMTESVKGHVLCDI